MSSKKRSAGVASEIGVCAFFLAEVGNEGENIAEAVIGDSHGAGGEARIAAAQRFRRAFEHEDRGAAFARRSAAHSAALPAPTTTTSGFIARRSAEASGAVADDEVAVDGDAQQQADAPHGGQHRRAAIGDQRQGNANTGMRPVTMATLMKT